MGIFFVITNILAFSLSGFLTAIIYGLIYGYVFACLYSLYIKLRDEPIGHAQYGYP
jgi:tetrahydromethanopterin S-methyltransferase subunit B